MPVHKIISGYCWTIYVALHTERTKRKHKHNNNNNCDTLYVFVLVCACRFVTLFDASRFFIVAPRGHLFNFRLDFVQSSECVCLCALRHNWGAPIEFVPTLTHNFRFNQRQPVSVGWSVRLNARYIKPSREIPPATCGSLCGWSPFVCSV